MSSSASQSSTISLDRLSVIAKAQPAPVVDVLPTPYEQRQMLRDAALVLAACEELDDLIQALRSDRLNEDIAGRLRTWLDRTRPAAVVAHQRLTLALS